MVIGVWFHQRPNRVTDPVDGEADQVIAVSLTPASGQGRVGGSG